MEAVKKREVCCDARRWVPWGVVPVCLVFVLLGCLHFNCRFEAKMFDHLEDCRVAKTTVLPLEGGYGILADCVQNEFLPHFFNAEVVVVTLLFNFVLCHILLARSGRVACSERVS